MEKLSNYVETSSVDNEIEEYVRELYNEIVTDEEVLKEIEEQGFTKQEIYDNVHIFYEMYKSRVAEREIKTYQDCIDKNLFYKVNVIKEDGIFKTELEALPAHKKHIRYNASFIYKDFDSKYENVLLSNNKDEFFNQSLRRKINNALKADKRVYLYGSINTGRTYAAIAFTNTFLENHPGAKVAFIDAKTRFSELEKIYKNDIEDFKNILSKIIKCDLLVIDNLGDEAITYTSRDQILLPILNGRVHDGQRTIIIAKKEINVLSGMYLISAYNKELNAIKRDELKELLSLNCEEILTAIDPLY
jgi:DNA replication protein DnaC